jgi:hypothetical protein
MWARASRYLRRKSLFEIIKGKRFASRLTSRPFGYQSNPLGGVAVLEVHPFNYEQIKHFISNWYLANERMSYRRDDPGVRAKAADGAQDLLQRLNATPSLFEMAVNPLLLTMIATVHRYRSSLPGKRVNLYEEICEVTLGKRQEARGVFLEMDARQKKQVLQLLAWTMMTSSALNQREISAADACHTIATTLQMVNPRIVPARFLKIIEESSGLLLERGQGIYSFAHLTFQEYLASTYAREEGLEAKLTQHIDKSWWHETIRLYCAQTDATAIVSACLQSQPPSVVALALALDCLDEAMKIDPAKRVEVERILSEWIDDPNPARRKLAAEVRLSRRLKNMVPIKEKIYRDTSLITVAEYELFLVEQRQRNLSSNPEDLSSLSFRIRGNAPKLGLTNEEAETFCEWLTNRAQTGQDYRLPYQDELPSEEAALKMIEPVSGHAGYWYRPMTDANTWLLPYFTYKWIKRPANSEFKKLTSYNIALSASIYLCIMLYQLTAYFTAGGISSDGIGRQLFSIIQVLQRDYFYSELDIKIHQMLMKMQEELKRSPEHDGNDFLSQVYMIAWKLLAILDDFTSIFQSHPIQNLLHKVDAPWLSDLSNLQHVHTLLCDLFKDNDETLLAALTTNSVQELAALLESELDYISSTLTIPLKVENDWGLDSLLIEASLDLPADLSKFLLQMRIEHLTFYLKNYTIHNLTISEILWRFCLKFIRNSNSHNINANNPHAHYVQEIYQYALKWFLREQKILLPCEGILLVHEPAKPRVKIETLVQTYDAVRTNVITDPAIILDIALRFEQLANDPVASKNVTFDALRAANTLRQRARKIEFNDKEK